jgi:hypothetical protein
MLRRQPSFPAHLFNLGLELPSLTSAESRLLNLQSLQRGDRFCQIMAAGPQRSGKCWVLRTHEVCDAGCLFFGGNINIKCVHYTIEIYD